MNATTNSMQESPEKTAASGPQAGGKCAVQIQNLSFSYGSSEALKNITLNLDRNAVTAFIGPSGCGKSTLLRCINRMNDEIVGARVTATRSRPNPAGHLEPFAKVRRSLLLDRFCASFATLLCRPTIMMDTVQADAKIRATLRAGLTPSGLP